MLPPGGEGEIKVTLDPKGGHAKIHKRIVVVSNDPEQPQFALTVEATPLVDMMAKPARVSIADLPLRKPGREVFALHRNADSTADVRSIRVEGDKGFSVRRVDPEGDAHAAYEVRFRGRDTVGVSSTRVIVETTGENTPELVVPVRVSVAANLRYTEHVRLVRKEGQVEPRVVRITARDGDAPRIKRIEDPDGLLEVEVLPPSGQIASIRLVSREGMDATPDNAWHPLIVHTSDREQPRLELQYRIDERSKPPAAVLPHKGP